MNEYLFTFCTQWVGEEFSFRVNKAKAHGADVEEPTNSKKTLKKRQHCFSNQSNRRPQR